MSLPDVDPFREYPAGAELKTYTGGCHCRKFTFEFDYMADFSVRPPTDCSCSIDSMHNPLWIYGSQTRHFRMLPTSAPLSELSSYIWNTRITARHFCPVCGTVLMWRGLGGPVADRMGVNVRVLDDLEAKSLPPLQVTEGMPGKSPLVKERESTGGVGK